MVKKLIAEWQVLVIIATLIGSGIGYTSFLQRQINTELHRENKRADLVYFEKRRGEKLELEVEVQKQKFEENTKTLREIEIGMQLILRTLDRIDERNRIESRK